MATPAVKVQSGQKTMQNGTPNSFNFLTQNPDGTNLDVSSGYTAKVLILAKPAAQAAQSGTAKRDLSSIASFAYHNGSLDASFTQANSSEAVGSTTLQVLISNDSFATQSMIFNGFLTVAGDIE